MTYRIPVSGGNYALVDEEDYQTYSKLKWHLATYGYAVRHRTYKNDGYRDTKKVQLHREIMNAPDGYEVDHINGDTLDNRKCNLRLVTHHQNMFNHKIRVSNTSGYKGVKFNKKNKNYNAYIQYKTRQKFLGVFDNPEHAAITYNCVAKILFGQYAKLNEV